jgi:hypothetical protein
VIHYVESIRLIESYRSSTAPGVGNSDTNIYKGNQCDDTRGTHALNVAGAANVAYLSVKSARGSPCGRAVITMTSRRYRGRNTVTGVRTRGTECARMTPEML